VDVVEIGTGGHPTVDLVSEVFKVAVWVDLQIAEPLIDDLEL